MKPYLAGYFLQELASAQTTGQNHGQRTLSRKNKVGLCWTPERDRQSATRGQRQEVKHNMSQQNTRQENWDGMEPKNQKEGR